MSFPSILLFFRRTLISTPYFRSFLSFHRCHSFPRFESFPTVQLLTETLYIICESDRSIKNTRIKREQNPPRLEKRIYICISVYDEVCEGRKQAFRLHDCRYRCCHCRLSESEVMAIATIVEAAGCSRKFDISFCYTHKWSFGSKRTIGNI